MARRRYRRYRRRSGRWAPNIVKISSQVIATSGEFSNSEDLVTNPIQTSTGVAQAFTVKNFEITFTLEAIDAGLNSLESITAYVMYVPQGMNVTSSYYAEHPEYIMTYKYLGSPSVVRGPNVTPLTTQETQQYQPYRIKTRLSRKLQTGDKVILYIQGSNEATTNQTYIINGLVRWWSKAN